MSEQQASKPGQRKPYTRPEMFNRQFIKASELAVLFDRPCSEHKGTKPAETNGKKCRQCDRWTNERTTDWMRRKGVAIDNPLVPGRQAETTMQKLLELDGVGDVLLQRMTPEEVQSMLNAGSTRDD